MITMRNGRKFCKTMRMVSFRSNIFNLILLLQFWPGTALLPAAGSAIEQDAQGKRVILSDAGHNLVLRLDYNGRCILDQVNVGGRQVVSSAIDVCSAIKIDGQWFTTRAG